MLGNRWSELLRHRRGVAVRMKKKVPLCPVPQGTGGKVPKSDACIDAHVVKKKSIAARDGWLLLAHDGASLS